MLNITNNRNNNYIVRSTGIMSDTISLQNFTKSIIHILANLTQKNLEKLLKTTLKKNTLSHVEKQMHGRSYSYKVHKTND